MLNPSKILTEGLKLADEAFHTDQEKAEHQLKKNEIFNEYLKNTSGYVLARRVIAITATVVYFSNYLLRMLFIILGIWFDLADEVALINENIEALSTLYMVIIGFYFGGGMIGTLADIRKEKPKLSTKGKKETLNKIESDG